MHRIVVTLAGCFCILSGIFCKSYAVGQSAVLTLTFPPGARATALGEAFVGVADDVNATFFNPAGLGQSPLSNSWKAFLTRNEYQLTTIASRKKLSFGQKEKIWVGTSTGILRFNGKKWETCDSYLIEQNDDLRTIAERFLPNASADQILTAIGTIMATNQIEQSRLRSVTGILYKELVDSTIKGNSKSVHEFATSLLIIPATTMRLSSFVEILSGKVDSTRIKQIAQTLDDVCLAPDKQFSDLVELKIPFCIAVSDSVTALDIDAADRIWVGTQHGIWRYDGLSWKHIGSRDGLPSDTITTIVTGSSEYDIAVGTPNGASMLTDSSWVTIDTRNGLPDNNISALTFGKNNSLYIGTPAGLVQKSKDSVIVFDTAKGLLSANITALLFDSQNKLWIGGYNGITIFDEKVWKRYRFPDSRISGFSELHAGKMWIASNRGAVTYTAGKITEDHNGKTIELPPDWKVFHSKNALAGDNVKAITVQGSDMWLVTEKGVNKYDFAEKQIDFFYEPVLPQLVSDIWHAYSTASFPTEDWGTFGLFVNFLNFGINVWTTPEGREIGRARSWEGVFALCYGLALKEDLSFGLNIKYIHSALAPGYGKNGEGVGQDFAIDAAVLKRNVFKDFDMGLHFQNMGPAIFYISEDEKDPIPFTIKFGMSYRAFQTPIQELRLLLDFDREFVKVYNDSAPDPFYKAIYSSLADNSVSWQQKLYAVNAHAGLEYWYADFVAVRTGFLLDREGERYEWTFGLGLKYGNMNFDWSYIYSPEGFMKNLVGDNQGSHGVRNAQWRASFIFKY